MFSLYLLLVLVLFFFFFFFFFFFVCFFFFFFFFVLFCLFVLFCFFQSCHLIWERESWSICFSYSCLFILYVLLSVFIVPL